MMKKAGYLIIAIACIALIVTGFYFSSRGNAQKEENLTETEKLIVKDLDKDYPKTPREVVKFYNRILGVYYGGEATDEQIEKLVDQSIYLLDEDLLLANPRESYYKNVAADIEAYRSQNKKIVSSDVCSSNDVKYISDVKEGTTEKDELAYVNASYFVNTNGKFAYTYQQFVLRRDEDGRWKILVFYEVEGESSDD